MMKELYTTPAVEVISFDAKDVIATSDPSANVIPGLPDDLFFDEL